MMLGKAQDQTNREALTNKQGIYLELASPLTLPIVDYLGSHLLLTLLLSGFQTRIRQRLKSKSCVYNAQYARRLYGMLGVIRSVQGLGPCWSTCCLTPQTTAMKYTLFVSVMIT